MSSNDVVVSKRKSSKPTKEELDKRAKQEEIYLKEANKNLKAEMALLTPSKLKEIYDANVGKPKPAIKKSQASIDAMNEKWRNIYKIKV